MKSIMFIIDTSEDMKASKDVKLTFFRDNIYYTTDEKNFNDYVKVYPLIIFEGQTGGCSKMETDLNVSILELGLNPKELGLMKFEEAITKIYDRLEEVL